MATIKITLACAYCHGHVEWSQGAIRCADGRGKLLRGDTIAKLQCGHCGSVFEVVLSTLRKRQGTKYKALVAKAKAEDAKRYADAQRRNSEIGEQLLAQPGCTCAAKIARDAELFGRSGGRRMGRDGDHPLVTSWSNGLPQTPHHAYGCPLRGSVEEAALLDSFAHNAKTGAA